MFFTALITYCALWDLLKGLFTSMSLSLLYQVENTNVNSYLAQLSFKYIHKIIKRSFYKWYRRIKATRQLLRLYKAVKTI